MLTLNRCNVTKVTHLNNFMRYFRHPPVTWAQRNDVLFVTVNLETKDPEIKLVIPEKNSIEMFL